ncbi:MAG TPA: STAS domain-containing protein [Pyrinomonadaceae bacterium]|jgi:anti-anti-sigma regulatory factor
MPTQITQIDDPDRGMTILRVEGQIVRDDAVLLARLARGLNDASYDHVAIDVADADFIDSEAASILKDLQTSYCIELTGIETLLQNAINEVERH